MMNNKWILSSETRQLEIFFNNKNEIQANEKNFMKHF